MSLVVEKFCNVHMNEPIEYKTDDFSVAVFTQKKREHDQNEDSLGVVIQGGGNSIVAVADGVGGHKQGEVASMIAIDEIIKAVGQEAPKDCYQSQILHAFDQANLRILGLNNGAGTTLIVMELTPEWVRYYCAGDSAVEVVGGKGKKKYRSIGHSSFDLAIEAGIIDESKKQTNINPELRNTITNVVGAKDMRIEIGSKHRLDDRDVIVMGSDGLFDNVMTDKVLQKIRSKTPLKVCLSLVEAANHQMYQSEPSESYSKPDDLSLIVAMRYKESA